MNAKQISVQLTIKKTFLSHVIRKSCALFEFSSPLLQQLPNGLRLWIYCLLLFSNIGVESWNITFRITIISNPLIWNITNMQFAFSLQLRTETRFFLVVWLFCSISLWSLLIFKCGVTIFYDISFGIFFLCNFRGRKFGDLIMEVYNLLSQKFCT